MACHACWAGARRCRACHGMLSQDRCATVREEVPWESPWWEFSDTSDSVEGYGDRVLVVDFGSQTTQLIARRVREHGVYCEIHPFDLDDETVREFASKGIILSGGPETVTEKLTPRIPQSLFDAGVSILGICYGMQAMATQLGGRVTGSARREFGHATARMATRRCFAA